MSHLVCPFLHVEAYPLISLPKINKSVEQEILIPVDVTLGVHIFCDGVCRQLSDVAIFKFNKVLSSVKDRVLVCPSDWVTL